MGTAYGVSFVTVSGFCYSFLLKILVLLNLEPRRVDGFTIRDELQTTRADPQEQTKYESDMTKYDNHLRNVLGTPSPNQGSP